MVIQLSPDWNASRLRRSNRSRSLETGRPTLRRGSARTRGWPPFRPNRSGASRRRRLSARSPLSVAGIQQPPSSFPVRQQPTSSQARQQPPSSFPVPQRPTSGLPVAGRPLCPAARPPARRSAGPCRPTGHAAGPAPHPPGPSGNPAGPGRSAPGPRLRAGVPPVAVPPAGWPPARPGHPPARRSPCPRRGRFSPTTYSATAPATARARKIRK